MVKTSLKKIQSQRHVKQNGTEHEQGPCIIITWCILISEAVTVPRLMMIDFNSVRGNQLRGTTDTHTNTASSTLTFKQKPCGSLTMIERGHCPHRAATPPHPPSLHPLIYLQSFKLIKKGGKEAMTEILHRGLVV